MDLTGPWFVRGRAVNPGLSLDPGDSLIVLASGILEARLPNEGSSRRVSPDGLAVPAGPTFLAPGLETLALVARIGNQGIVLRDGIKVMGGLRTPVSDTDIALDVNAPPNTTFAPGTGWSVYVVRVRAAETAPQLRTWHSFRDLVAAPAMNGPVVAAVLNSIIHVFWTQAGAVNDDLMHLTIEPDGTVGAPDQVDSSVLGFTGLSAIVHRGAMNVFYSVGRRPSYSVLRRALRDPAGGWDRSDIDGDTRQANTAGAIDGKIGLSHPASVGNTLHVLYRADGDANNAVLADLRHAQVTINGPEPVPGAPYVWGATTIDGAGGASGRVAGDVAASVAVTLDVASQVHVFYNSGALALSTTAGFDLRHAELDWTGGAQQTWRFETIDGAGRTFANATGQLSARVGMGTGCVLHDGGLHVAYNDMTHDNLRYGSKPQGGAWSFETLDGNASYAREPRFGTTNNRIRRTPKSLVSLGDQLSIFYDDETNNVVRHACKRRGLEWMFETVDGDVAYGGRIRGVMGSPVAVVRDGMVNLLYFDASRERIRHAILS